MERFYRLEDALPAWRVKARLITSGTAAQPPFDRLAVAAIAWLDEHGAWLNPTADKARAAAEIEAALRRLVTPLAPIGAAAETRASAWAVPAAVGSALGALILSPLTFLWFDNRPIGLFGGGVLGAFLAVRGIAALLDHPRLVSFVRSAAPLATGGVVLGGVFRAIRGASLGWVRSALWLLAAPLVISVLKPQAAASAEPAREIAPGQAADIALAVAWAHPDRLSAPVTAVLAPPATETDLLPRPVIVALSQLQGDITRGGSDQDIRESCDELLQRLQEAGYAWKSFPRGTLFDPDMAALFDAFGIIPPGQAIRTQRAAMIRHGEVVQKGELRRV